MSLTSSNLYPAIRSASHGGPEVPSVSDVPGQRILIP